MNNEKWIGLLLVAFIILCLFLTLNAANKRRAISQCIELGNAPIDCDCTFRWCTAQEWFTVKSAK